MQTRRAFLALFGGATAAAVTSPLSALQKLGEALASGEATVSQVSGDMFAEYGERGFLVADRGYSEIVRVSEELLQDSAFDLTAFLSDEIARKVADREAAEWERERDDLLYGTGTNEPLGIMVADDSQTEPVFRFGKFSHRRVRKGRTMKEVGVFEPTGSTSIYFDRPRKRRRLLAPLPARWRPRRILRNIARFATGEG